MDRHTIRHLWDQAWHEGLWAAAWPRALADLSAEDAARQPAPGRHSIAQIVAHMLFWREDALRRLTAPNPPSPEAVAQSNFPAPAPLSTAAWDKLRAQFADAQARISAALADEHTDISRLTYVLPHDAYHFGQVAYLRALLGKPPLE